MKYASFAHNFFPATTGTKVSYRYEHLTKIFISLALLLGCESAGAQDYQKKPYQLPETTDNSRLEDYEVLGYDDGRAQTMVHLPSLSYIAKGDERNDGAPRGLSVTVGKRFTIVKAPDGKLISRPHVTHMGDGELVLRISPDADIVDEEMCEIV